MAYQIFNRRYLLIDNICGNQKYASISIISRSEIIQNLIKQATLLQMSEAFCSNVSFSNTPKIHGWIGQTEKVSHKKRERKNMR